MKKPKQYLIEECDPEVIEYIEDLEKDKKRLDFLQSLNDRAKYSGLCVLRESTMGRGWRLHEARFKDHPSDTYLNVRSAIDHKMRVGL